MNRRKRNRITIRQALGLEPLEPALRQCWQALAGNAYMPPSKWGISSLRIFDPRIGVRTWWGLGEPDSRTPVLNLYNHRLAPRDQGYDVRVTEVRDFRGGRATYNSHEGTDFAVPIGTTVVAPAAGVVRVVESLMYRGGLKVVIDHGRGLITLPGHLSRALVVPGELVERGQPVGLSGFSGLDGIVSFPWVAPHVHFAVLHNGEAVDPFAHDGQPSLWRDGNDPRPCAPRASGAPASKVVSTDWDYPAVDRVIASCRDPASRARLAAVDPPDQRAATLAYWRLLHGPMFGDHGPLVSSPHPREPRLDLPFFDSEISGCFIPR